MRVLFLVAGAALSACDGAGLPTRAPTLAQALTGTAEWLEFEPLAVRNELAREVARQSQGQAGKSGPVLFPLVRDGQLVAAPGLELRFDLLQAPDAGRAAMLSFAGAPERFGEERRDAFQGLSEREAAELIARSLLHHWGIVPGRTVVVQRTAGVPYAAAYADGVLKLNPAFIYLAAAPATP